MRFIYSKIFLIFVGVLVAVFIGLLMQAQGWLQPVEYVLLQAPQPVIRGVNVVTRPIATAVRTLGSLRGLVQENSELQQRVISLQESQVEFDRLASENEILKEELGFVGRTEFDLQPCRILSLDTQQSSDVINLNCGSEAGIEEGFAVIAKGHIFAKVVFVGNLTSSAVLLTNAQQTVDAKVSKNDTEGVVKGSFGSGLLFDLVSQSAEVGQGDLIVTAGIDPKIPRNILIGEVGQQLSGPNDLFKQLTVLSPVKVNVIDHVFIVKP